MSKHTPTPWSHWDGSNRFGLYIGVNYIPIGECGAGSKITSEVTKANAAFIVRAVNAHDELVAALEEALEALMFTNARSTAATNARAALAKAKETK